MAAPLIYIFILPTVVLLQRIHCVCKKNVSQETEITMSRLARPIPSDGAVHLYATNLEVDIHNHDCLVAMKEQLHMYQSTDTGMSSLLCRMYSSCLY